jgi:thymidylate synthase
MNNILLKNTSNKYKYLFNIIVAIDNKNGISSNNKIPWYISDDLKYFKNKTSNSIVIMGRDTYDTLPMKPLKNRFNMVMTRNKDLLKNDHKIENLLYFNFDNNLNKIIHLNLTDNFKLQYNFYEIYNILEEKKELLNKLNINNNINIIGGSKIYNLFLKMFEITKNSKLSNLNKIYITHINKNYKCDKFFPFLSSNFYLTKYSNKEYSQNENTHYRFLEYCLKDSNNDLLKDNEKEYLDISTQIIKKYENSLIRNDRTGVGIYSIFGTQIKYNISEFIPMLTTKKVAFKACIEELLWFLKGNTNNKILKDKNVHIWNGNSSREYLDKIGLENLKEDDCGACYGFQWRHFGAEYKDCNTDYNKEGIDQIQYVLNLLKFEPYSRRIFLSAWNPKDLYKTCLPPCHVSIQFFVEEIENIKYLSGHMYQRSADWFLGEPFNILSYTALIYLFAELCDMKPNKLIISTGDTHIYTTHIEQMKIQNEREILVKPKLWINPDVKNKNLEDIEFNDFQLIGYQSHPTIKGQMAV